jgi:hypothetical protein
MKMKTKSRKPVKSTLVTGRLVEITDPTEIAALERRIRAAEKVIADREKVVAAYEKSRRPKARKRK